VLDGQSVVIYEGSAQILDGVWSHLVIFTQVPDPPPSNITVLAELQTRNNQQAPWQNRGSVAVPTNFDPEAGDPCA
jgi:hypothetical protein